VVIPILDTKHQTVRDLQDESGNKVILMSLGSSMLAVGLRDQ
jgi:hypothetical protein